MGIPSYFSYIVKNHLRIIKKLKDSKITVNNLYLDCNSIIYDAVRTIDFGALVESDVDTIIGSVCRKVEEYIQLLRPDNTVFVAFDGVAPVAKLEQQRTRRYKSLYQNQVTKSIFGDTKGDPWNTTAITPGTVFMQRLNERVKRHFQKASKYQLQRLIVSGSDEHGEGEHKLFQYIRDNAELHRDTCTVIYGLDADLIMLSINHLPVSPKLYLFRETPQFVQSISVELEPNEAYIMDIPELATAILSEMVKEGVAMKRGDYRRVYDYIFLCFFLGNDFMPHFPAINIRTGGVNKMMNAYKATLTETEYLTDGRQIFWPNVRKLVSFLAQNELMFLQKEAKLRDSRGKRVIVGDTPEDKFEQFNSIPTTDRVLEKYIDPFKDGWQMRYYKSLFQLEMNAVRREQIGSNYLQGLEWTIKYYTVGCPDWRWKYNYHYPPLLSDLLCCIPTSAGMKYFGETMQARPVSPMVQLCYVLPEQSLHLLPESLYKRLKAKKGKWYTSDCPFVWAYCRYFWESHVDLPHIDMAELESFVHS